MNAIEKPGTKQSKVVITTCANSTIRLPYHEFLNLSKSSIFILIPSEKYTISNAHSTKSEASEISKNISKRIMILMISFLFFLKNSNKTVPSDHIVLLHINYTTLFDKCQSFLSELYFLYHK